MRRSSVDRLIVLLAVLLVSFALAGCGEDDASESASAQQSAQSTAEAGATGEGESQPGGGEDAAAEDDANAGKGQRHPEVPLRPNVNSRKGSKGGSGGTMGEVTPVDNLYSAVTSKVVFTKPEVRIIQSAAAFDTLRTKQFGSVSEHSRELQIGRAHV